jgi:hypothetical protein
MSKFLSWFASWPGIVGSWLGVVILIVILILLEGCSMHTRVGQDGFLLSVNFEDKQ